MALSGVAIGLAAAFGFTRLMRAQWFTVKPTDPLTFMAVPLVLLLVAVTAAYVPALRASRVDPLVALRHE
jgi:ABC-type antimicrobial peptide transport system permease subunit